MAIAWSNCDAQLAQRIGTLIVAAEPNSVDLITHETNNRRWTRRVEGKTHREELPVAI